MNHVRSTHAGSIVVPSSRRQTREIGIAPRAMPHFVSGVHLASRAGEGQNHRQGEADGENDVPIISWDYGFLGAKTS